MKKIICIFLSIMIVLNLILSLNFLLKERVVLNLNSENREIIRQDLNYTRNLDSIKKIGIGKGWHSDEMYFYYSFGRVETELIPEGNKSVGNLMNYIDENGYSLDRVAFILFCSSIVYVIIIIVVYNVNL